MEELLGISNLGFSFTETYLSDICSLIDYVCSHQTEATNYIGLQNSLSNPSRVRMIVPFLRNMGIINNSCFSGANTDFVLKDLFADSGRPFVKAIEIYSLIKSSPDDEPKKRWRIMFKTILMERYLSILCRTKSEYLEFIRFLLKNNTIDKFEFFAVTTMRFNGVKRLFSCDSVDDLIAKYRTIGIDPSLYFYKTDVNCYSYIMAVLCDFDVCTKSDGKYILKNKERIQSLLGGLL